MGKVRYPLWQAFMNRNGTDTSPFPDTYVLNGYADKYGEKTYVIKRPGTDESFDFGTGTDPFGAFFFNGFYYGVYNDTLYRNTGATNTGADGTTWTEAPVPDWYGRSFFTATVFQDRIYVIGGAASAYKADIWYTSDGVKWAANASAAPFSHRQGHQVVVFNNQLFLTGGFQLDSSVSQVQNDVWSSSDGANWTQIQANAAWAARDNHSLVAANNGMYLYGGGGNGIFYDDVWFSTDGITWTELTSTATGTPRQLQSMMFFQNKLWIIGGYNSSAVEINDSNSSPDGQTWTTTSPIFPAGRGNMAETIYNGKMWLIAGTMAGVEDSNVYSSSDGTTWTLVTSTPGFSARAAGEAVTFKTPYSVDIYRYETMWFLGGSDGVTQFNEVWRADLNSPLATSYPLSPDVPAQYYQFNTFLNGSQLLLKNQSNFWVLQAGTLTKVTDNNYPAVTVPGLVVLNLFAYVMTPDGEILSCSIEDPLSWKSLQFVYASYEDDPGVGIVKYYNYIVAFGSYTTQFFYDAGNPAPGIAISPYQSATSRVGCWEAATIQNIQNTIMWVGQTSDRGVGVYMFDGLSPKRVSTSWVDKMINESASANIRALVISIEGHSFYVVTLLFNSLAYDFTTGQWSVWNYNGGDTRYPYLFSVSDLQGGVSVLYGSGPLAGKVLFVDFQDFDDNGNPFIFQVQTDKMDGNNLERKYWGRIDFVSDTNPATATIEVTDDDYQSYTTWGTVDLSFMRPYLTRGGSSRRRALRITQTDSEPARWEAVDLTFSQGES